jgi:hypothetical protein
MSPEACATSVSLTRPHLQLAVSFPGGSKCVCYALRSGLSCCPRDVILQLDQNAFNNGSQQALL